MLRILSKVVTGKKLFGRSSSVFVDVSKRTREDSHHETGVISFKDNNMSNVSLERRFVSLTGSTCTAYFDNFSRCLQTKLFSSSGPDKPNKKGVKIQDMYKTGPKNRMVFEYTEGSMQPYQKTLEEMTKF